jgi:hypothetical protein
MIEQLAGFPGKVIAVVSRGHATKHDYESVLVPAAAKALKENDKAWTPERCGRISRSEWSI